MFLVRKGNPKGLKSWDDLVKPGVQVITPNPKTSGGARWNYLAARAHASEKSGGDEQRARVPEGAVPNVPVLDSGARGSTTTFVERGIGDVLLAWENEALLAVEKLGNGKLEIVVPTSSILAEPPVAVVEKNVERHGTRGGAGVLEFLYTPEGQELAAKHNYRPRDAAVAARYASRFPKLRLVTIDGAFGGWQKAQATHFLSDGGVFDQIYTPGL